MPAMNIEQARYNMIEQQIRPWDVLDQDVLSLLALAVLVMGLWPYPFLDVMHASVEHLLQQVNVSKL